MQYYEFFAKFVFFSYLNVLFSAGMLSLFRNTCWSYFKRLFPLYDAHGFNDSWTPSDSWRIFLWTIYKVWPSGKNELMFVPMFCPCFFFLLFRHPCCSASGFFSDQSVLAASVENRSPDQPRSLSLSWKKTPLLSLLQTTTLHINCMFCSRFKRLTLTFSSSHLCLVSGRFLPTSTPVLVQF